MEYNKHDFVVWGERITQRISSADWKKELLNNGDKIIYAGSVRTLVAKNLGHGVLEISMMPQKKDSQ